MKPQPQSVNETAPTGIFESAWLANSGPILGKWHTARPGEVHQPLTTNMVCLRRLAPGRHLTLLWLDRLVVHAQTTGEAEPEIWRMVRELLSSSTAAPEAALATSDTGSTAQAEEDALIFEEYESLRHREIEATLTNLFWCARSELLEDGVESDFTRLLEQCVLEYGDDAIEAVENLLLRVNSSILAEALAAFGRMEDPGTEESRFWLLVTSLSHPSPEVRDAAGLGLASLRDPRGEAHLRRAAAREPVAELRVELLREAEFLEV